MRLARLNASLVGGVLARDLLDRRGKALLKAGTVLSPRYIALLQERGYTHVYLQDDSLPGDVPVDAVTAETRALAEAEVARVVEQVRRGADFDASAVAETVDRLLEELWESGEVVYCLSALRSRDAYLLTHSVNVAILSIVVGKHLSLPVPAVRELGIGAILHDFGKLWTPGEILDKPGRLTPEEFEVIKRHPTDGWLYLSARYEIPYPSAMVAYAHHEQLDGGGYPRGIGGDAISLYARVASVADVYDAVVADRPYRPARTALEAVSVLREGAGPRFDPRVVEVFLRHVAVFPNASLVRLSTGELGVVVGQEPGAPDRPQVAVIREADGSRPRPARLVRLVEHPEIGVQPAAEEEGTPPG